MESWDKKPSAVEPDVQKLRTKDVISHSAGCFPFFRDTLRECIFRKKYIRGK